MIVLWIIIVLVSIGLDQLTKILVMNNFTINEVKDFIPGIINFRYIRNEGAAWGMLSDHRWVFIVITIISICIIPFFMYKYRKTPVLFNLSLSLILGGAIGNLIDRIALGSVTDFIEFSFFDFPVFNVADSCVTVGAFLLAIYFIFFDKVILVDTKKETKKVEVMDVPTDAQDDTIKESDIDNDHNGTAN